MDGQHIVIQQLQEKFPLGMLEKLEESRDDDPWTVKTLRKAIARYVDVKERAEHAYALADSKTPTTRQCRAFWGEPERNAFWRSWAA